MFNAGDKVRLNIALIEENGVAMTDDKFQYILDHPEEVYIVSTETAEAHVIAKIILEHPVLKSTSFFEDELILVGGNV